MSNAKKEKGEELEGKAKKNSRVANQFKKPRKLRKLREDRVNGQKAK